MPQSAPNDKVRRLIANVLTAIAVIALGLLVVSCLIVGFTPEIHVISQFFK